jgi:hypothetical protein
MQKLFILLTACILSSCITVVQQKSPQEIEKERTKKNDDDYQQATQAMKNIEDSYMHVKGINPDPDIPITKYKLTHTPGGTHLAITFKNKSGTPLFYVEFGWRLFDKNGKELRYDKEQWGATGVSLLHKESDTEQWTFDPVPNAETAEIKLRKSRLADTVRDY